MKKSLLLLSAAVALLNANVTQIETNLVQSIVPGTKLLAVEKSQINGLYFGCMRNGDVLYVDPFNKILFFGGMYNSQGQELSVNHKNSCVDALLDEQINNLSAGEIEALVNNGVKVVHGSGSKNKFIFFKSPTCPHCIDISEAIEEKNITLFKYMPESELSTKEYIKDGIDENATSKLFKAQIAAVNELKIKGVPFFIVLDENSSVIDTIKGADLKKIEKYLK